ncbi:type I-A CRISPR-associated protein Cas7/Csa2 [Stygiolobus caldivivus]|uniref:Type I-A CRISPR-associated protein Cas7/Csa2 n=1 Tax=Stygiolobus caldivivus TaxID=2824673 RepID=A0A8D5U5Q3_9CREN|nr:type I-A CRISPR-associated protein Cas7/Csa2 [Stygiolobus caldivivus]BCU69798.1 type I-A CRISPR-associated protein Cas7/Csa2 [Stygiolobus caldivivus]
MISGSFRFLINTESLNGVETVGNLARHRTAPVVLKTPTGYLIRYVPAVSGESLAHAYQVAVVDLAQKYKLPVGVYSSKYDFIKFSSEEVLKDEGIKEPKDAEDARRFEVEVMLKDVVADIGGFMYAGGTPVRRTSRVKFGYMIPALTGEDIPAQLESQFHVRSSTKGQMIYNVEVSSALYTMSFSLDEDLVAVPSTEGKEVEGEKALQKQRKDRVEVALKALYYVLTGNFGGRRARFLPNMELMSGIVTVTDFPFMPEPGHTNDYITSSIKRLEKAKSIMNGKGEAYVIDNEGLGGGEGAKKLASAEELVEELLKVALKQ